MFDRPRCNINSSGDDQKFHIKEAICITFEDSYTVDGIYLDESSGKGSGPPDHSTSLSLIF